MANKTSQNSDMSINRECSSECEFAYRKCLGSKEDESVCRMKRAQCRCSCS